VPEHRQIDVQLRREPARRVEEDARADVEPCARGVVERDAGLGVVALGVAGEDGLQAEAPGVARQDVVPRSAAPGELVGR
jgi:hypothetical protein